MYIICNTVLDGFYCHCCLGLLAALSLVISMTNTATGILNGLSNWCGYAISTTAAGPEFIDRMNHIHTYRFISLASQIEEDPERKAKLKRALRKLEQLKPNVIREVPNDGDNLPASENVSDSDTASHAA
jgi:hypothetical protein